MRYQVMEVLVTTVALLGACQEVVPYGDPCVPGRDLCSYGGDIGCVADCFQMRTVCGLGPDLAPPYQDPGCQVDGACRTDACETVFNCPQDCRLDCDVQAFSGAPPLEFLVTAVRFPQSSSEAKATGCDLDGDLTIDNKVAGVLALIMPEIRDPSSSYETAIASGRLIVVLRVYPEGPPGQGLGLVQLVEAQLEDGSPPRLDGSDRLVLLPGTGDASPLCGRWDGERLTTNPGDNPVPVPVPTPDGSEILMRVHLEGARLDGEIEAAGLTGVFLAGGIPPAELRVLLYASIGRDPLLLDLTDGCPEYGNSIEGCENLVPGMGECTKDGRISEIEFRCHAIINQILAPDVPPAHEGGEPRVSLGVALDAVPATIVH